jgi:2-oxoglutarate ferredoxin oxidoreductase subunit alpha
MANLVLLKNILSDKKKLFMPDTKNQNKSSFIDGSRLITESCVRAGADIFIGYPITPANLLYLYAGKRYPKMMAAPDEITTLQWMAGFAATGHIPVTATSFPGYALMIESINMAFMMELPMVIILVQRLGPATGTATAGAMGDLLVVNGTISGGFNLPSFSISSMKDCWDLPPKAIETAVKLRTPVVLLTSKEMIMTLCSFDLSDLENIDRKQMKLYEGNGQYFPYKPDNEGIPPFLPLTQNIHQIRFTASTHDMKGILQNSSPEAINNTKRLQNKIINHLDSYSFYEADEQAGADTLIVSYDVSAQAAREAATIIRAEGKKVSLLIAKTILPVPDVYIDIISRYPRVVIAEENLDGQFRNLLFGKAGRKGVTGVNGIAKMISPEAIITEVMK